jgi:hypothetical protein
MPNSSELATDRGRQVLSPSIVAFSSATFTGEAGVVQLVGISAFLIILLKEQTPQHQKNQIIFIFQVESSCAIALA